MPESETLAHRTNGVRCGSPAQRTEYGSQTYLGTHMLQA